MILTSHTLVSVMRTQLLAALALFSPAGLNAQLLEVQPLEQNVAGAGVIGPSGIPLSLSPQVTAASFVPLRSDTPVNLPSQEDYGSGSSGLAYGAAVGGIIGVLAVAIHTVRDNDEEPLSFFEAVGIPIGAGLVGGVIGLLVSP